jgi:hypothetical protein
MIVVHQMAKVASMAWVEAARPVARQMGTMPIHTHFLTARNLQSIAAILAVAPPDNTIVNPYMARSILRSGNRAVANIRAGRELGQRIRVITGMRDPVARSLSLLAFFADFCGHSSRSLSARDGADAHAVCALLVELWRLVLARTAPAGSFERLLWHMMGAYRNWFSEELATVFDADIYSSPFPQGGGVQHLRGHDAQILVYRAEDMHPGAPPRSVVLDAARQFLGAPGAALTAVNTAATRRSYPLYVQARNLFHLPAAMLDEIYDEPVIRHFYGAREIAGFKLQWAAPRDSRTAFPAPSPDS